ncbi:hypothetical protein I4U23_001049 [Adineta vaga]|nr:hypothetical protein I4U23_001049 [Adineta vaga]
MHQFSFIDEIYTDSKNIRSSSTSKQFRRLTGLESVYYKKTYEVTKTGHQIQNIHQLNDGGLHHIMPNLKYSLNKRKRWLLPDIIEQRILETNPLNKTATSIIDERLKIVMYENENIRHTSNCIRYANSQAVPQIIYKNGRRFNSNTLSSWIDFNTRERWGRRRRHRRSDRTDRVNQPNFGITQRPGFFPSEVTYKFSYPKRLPESAKCKTGKSTLFYKDTEHLHQELRRGYGSDITKHRRRMQKQDCKNYDPYKYTYSFDEEDFDDNEMIMLASNQLDENEKWSIVFEDSDEQYTGSIDFPIDYFIPIPCKSPRRSNDTFIDEINDSKAHKYFEPPPTPPSPSPSKEKSSIANETLLCSMSCLNESDFLTQMQQSTKNISQANLSPAIFLQRTSSSSFSVIYTYDRTSSTINVTVKYTDVCPKILFDQKTITLAELTELVSRKLDEYSIEIDKKSISNNSQIHVDDLRGSLPLPMHILRRMLLVQPHSTDKQKALQNEHINTNQKQTTIQWFDTLHNEYDMLECSICCDVLTANDACQLLPCNHILCQTCLATYVRTSIASATYSSSSTSPLTCFQPNCTTQLNSCLLQAFLSFEIYHLYIDALIDRQLFSSGKYRKCPSRACSNLLIVDEINNQTSMCSCGQRVCLKCFDEYHFPATCRQYKTYVETLRKSGDDILSSSKTGDNSDCYIAEGKNCPNCGEFVEKNGGCPHMTCKCGNEYCWMCLKPWISHNSAICNNVTETTHELRSSTRNRLHNKAVNHRRQRNQYAFDQLSTLIQRSTLCSPYYDILISTYIDLNTLAEYIYVLLQRRRIDVYIRAVLGQTAKRLALDASQIKLQVENRNIRIDLIEKIRCRLERTNINLLHMKNTKVLI